MGDFPSPEILRVPLDSLCLQIKVMRESEDVAVSAGERDTATWPSDTGSGIGLFSRYFLVRQ